MKILLVIDTLGSGGAQRQMITLAKSFCNKGHQVTLFYYNAPHYFLDHIKDYPIQIKFIQKKSKFGFRMMWSMSRFIRKNSFDIALSFMIAPSFHLLIANLLTGKKTKVVLSERTFEDCVPSLHKKFRYFYRFADYILANSYHQQEVLKKLFPKYHSKIGTIGNGVIFSEFKFREQHVFDSGELKIIGIGRIAKLKNIRILIQALNILVNEYKLNVVVNYVGREPEKGEDELEHEICLSLLREYHLENKWKWLGQVSNVDFQLEQNDILVHPSLGEGFPNAVCEAMIKGIPVFASNVYDHPKVIQHGKNGFLFPTDQPRELAELLRNFHFLSQEQKIKLVQEAHIFANNNFDIHAVCSQYETLFKRLL